MLRLVAPSIYLALINDDGLDGNDIMFEVKEVSLSVLKNQMIAREIRVFEKETKATIAQIPEIQTSLLQIFFKEIVSFNVKELTVILSRELQNEAKRLKREKPVSKLIELTGHFEKIIIKENLLGDIRTILSLKKMDLIISNRTRFVSKSYFAEGGTIEVKGDTKLQEQENRWMISGDIKNVPKEVIEKLAGDKMVLTLEKANLNASLVAHSTDGMVEGELVPEIKDFKLKVEEDKGFVKKNIAKVANYLYKKTKEEKGEVVIKLPFKLSENFILSLPVEEK